MTKGMDADESAIGGTNYGRVRDAIRDRIVGGIYLPGTRLKVHDLCDQFGISSNPIREALQQLQGEGLVVILPNKGATVRLIDEHMIRHIYEIGEGLDGILANRCAAIATPPQVERLRDIQHHMEAAAAAGDSEGRANYNGEFHTHLGAISGNTEAVDIRRRHQNLIRTIRQRYGYSPYRIEQIHVEHWAIIDAIAARDVAAAELAARIHCVRSCEDMLSRYKGFGAEVSEHEK
ncbi:GntR family transcriptional regulator [Devosia sp.]|uniref:GntR family transcriptional regulator n=1 Tax=Devosia sp. TaxID=1871048 RepID=UPI0026025CDA|nr:GntR family transcriptional regulator [Devosia sp.]